MGTDVGVVVEVDSNGTVDAGTTVVDGATDVDEDDSGAVLLGLGSAPTGAATNPDTATIIATARPPPARALRLILDLLQVAVAQTN